MIFQTSAPAAFNRVIQAERAHTSQSVEIVAISTLKGKTVKTIYDETVVRPDQLKIRIREAGNDRTYYFFGGKMTAYEPITNQYLVRRGLSGGLSQKVGEALGAFDPLALLPADPGVAENFFAPLKKQSGWSAASSQSGVRLNRVAGSGIKRAQVDMLFSSSTMLPLQMRFAQPGNNSVQLTFTYRPVPAIIYFSVPKGAKAVESFSVHKPLPKFLSRAAQEETENCMRAYGSLRAVAFRAQGEGENNLVLWMGSTYSQQSAKVVWIFDGKQLSVLDKMHNKLYRGRPGTSRIGDFLAPLGSRVDPTLRLLINQRNPMEALFVPGMTVRLAGQMTLQGVKTTILELKSRGLRIQVEVNGASHLITGIVSENIDDAGHVVSSSKRSFEYVTSPVRLQELKGGQILPLTALHR